MASKKKASAAEPDITAMGINAEAAAAIAAQVVQRTEEKFGAESTQLMKPLLQHGRLLLAIDTQQHAAVEALTRCCMLAEVHDGATVQANCLTMMSIAALSQFEYAAAENAASQALRLVTMMPDELVTDEVDQLSIQAQNVLGEARRELGFPQRGFDMHQSALTNARQIGVNHLCADATRGMGKCMVALAAGTQADDATGVLSDAVLLYREAWGDSALTARALCEYGEHLRNCERYDEAEKALREAVQLQSVCCKSDSVEVAQVCKILGSLLLARKQSLAEALALVERGVAIFDKLESRPHNTAVTTAALADRSASTLTFKGMILDETGKYDEAAMVQRTVVERYTQLVGADHPYTQAMKQQLEFYEAKGDRQVAVVAEQINSGVDDGTVPAATGVTAGKSGPQGSSASYQGGKKRRRRKRTKTKSVDQPPPSATPSHAQEASAKGRENSGEEPSLGLPSTSRGPSVIGAPLVAAASSKPVPLIKSFAAAAAPLMAAAPVAPLAPVVTLVAASAAAVPASAVTASAVTRAKQPKQPKVTKEATPRHPGSQDHRQKHKNKNSAQQHNVKATKNKGSFPAAARAAAAATDPAVPRPGAVPAAAPSVAALGAPDEEVVSDEGVSTTTPVPAELIQPADEADVLEADGVLAVIQPSLETAVLEADGVLAIIEPATESQIEDFDDDDDDSTDDELLVDAPAPAPAPASTAAAKKPEAVAAALPSSSSSLVVTGLRFASETGPASETAAAPRRARKASKLVRMQSHNNAKMDAADETAETVTADADAFDTGQATSSPTSSPKAQGIAVGPVDVTPPPPLATDGDNSTLLIIGSCVIGSAVAYLLWRQLSAGQARR